MKTNLENALVDLISSSPTNGTTEPKAITNARHWHNSCINESAIEEEGVDVILSFINKELGGWPVLLGDTWNESTFDFYRLILKLSQHNHFIPYTFAAALTNDLSTIRIDAIDVFTLELRILLSYLKSRILSLNIAVRTTIGSLSRANILSVQGIKAKIGYPDYFEKDYIIKLEKEYAEYNFNSSLMLNALKLNQLNSKNALRALRDPINKNEWMITLPTTISATYHILLNDITIPAAFLQNPLFNNNVPKYINYGGIGFIIGHEIAHGFDDDARKAIGSTSNLAEFDRAFGCKPGQSSSRVDKCNMW
ncbi:unnamed protein product [Rotaria sordida]|uniref:Peptidase M13 C-terminal domain-containing protein n=1 Tax=Rotaria sordida TaxID=392033 RepID=A0A815JY60_9BILA|nr:unnamed protein product [Rotaria sordida]